MCSDSLGNAGERSESSSSLSAEDRRELHEKAARILESDKRELFIAVLDLFYHHAMEERRLSERGAATPAGRNFSRAKNGRRGKSPSRDT
jgi:hypothetical protein